jgi:hypothetical protein
MENKKETTWDTLTPKELRNAKIISIIFIAVSLLVLMFLHKTIGMILLAIGLFFGSGPFVLSSKGSVKNMIYVLKNVEPGYKNWDDNKIEKQIKAIQRCGYNWFEKKGKVGFKHSKTGLYLRIDGLNYYEPEDIEKTYREVWSQDNPEQVHKRDATAQKLQEALLKNASDEEIKDIFRNHKK